MAITRWAPFGALASLEREMQSLERELHTLLGKGAGEPGTGWQPDIDVYRQGDVLVVRAELPGIDPAENLDIEVDGNVLRVRGHKQVEREVDDEDRYIRECRFGSFERDLPLPDGVEPESVTAVYENGVLTIRIPVPAGVVAGRRIPVTVQEGRKQASKISPD